MSTLKVGTTCRVSIIQPCEVCGRQFGLEPDNHIRCCGVPRKLLPIADGTDWSITTARPEADDEWWDPATLAERSGGDMPLLCDDRYPYRKVRQVFRTARRLVVPRPLRHLVRIQAGRPDADGDVLVAVWGLRHTPRANELAAAVVGRMIQLVGTGLDGE